jgi:hypothetical protein
MDFVEISDEFDVTVAEMDTRADSASALVRLDPDTIARVSEGDDDPKFATFIIESGKSRNGRIWNPEIFQNVAEQINNAGDVVGYLGHVKPEDSGHAFPPVQLHWLKARLNVTSDRCQMLAKAYVLPVSTGAVARDYIRRGFVKTVSWTGRVKARQTTRGEEISEFNLESIDLARPRTAGMKTVIVGGLTSEMEEGGSEVKPEEIAALQENELRAHNPNLAISIEEGAKKPVLADLETVRTELETSKSSADLVSQIRNALKLDDNADVMEALGALIAKAKEVAKGARTKYLDDILNRKFKDESTRNLVRRMLVTEMESGSLVSEMTKIENEEDDDKAKKETERVVNEFIDADDDLKKMVSEMTGSGGASFGDGNGSREIKKIEPGFENDLISVRKAGD